MNRTLATAAALAVCSVPQMAAAKLSCYPITQIERALDGEFGEMRSFAGKEATGIEYRLYVNTRTGSWSWIGIPAGAGIGCLIFAGRSNEASPGERQPKPDAQF